MGVVRAKIQGKHARLMQVLGSVLAKLSLVHAVAEGGLDLFHPINHRNSCVACKDCMRHGRDGN